MTEWSKAGRALILTLLVILFVVIGVVFAMKSDFKGQFYVEFGIKIAPTEFAPGRPPPEVM